MELRHNAGMTFNDRLALELSPDGALLFDPRPEHEVAPDVVHFAVLAALAEIAAARAAAAAVMPAQVSINLLRRAHAAPLMARGRVLKGGRTLIVAEGEVTQAGELVAKATVTFARLQG